MPIPKNYLDQWDVAIHEMGDDTVLFAEQEQFRVARSAFREKLHAKDPETLAEGWQRHYFVGRFPDGTEGVDHVNKLRLNQPVDRSGTRPLLAKPATDSPAANELLATARIRRWREGSLLDELDQRQTEANQAGRQRLREGVLTSTPATVAITPEMEIDPEALDFIYQPNFLTKAECALLVETAEALADRQGVEGIADPFWRGRILYFPDVLAARSGAAALMRDAQRRVTERLRGFYQLTVPVFADTVQLVRWRTGMHMPPHADRANADGSPHDMPFRDFASVVYLNDDYEGGELYFPRLDMTVKPAAGMLLAFTGGWHHEHGVLKVTAGERLTMPAFYTFDAAQRQRELYGIGPLAD
jgi:predicted 2-oxoglutarate/Fe(II)-dependent dioxygenase YbiX